MLRSGEQYLAALRDGRRVYIGSELVSDVTTHPAFMGTAHTFARIYERKRSPAHIDETSFEEGGERYSAWFLMARTHEDLMLRARAHELVARWTHGLMGRSPDHVSSYFAGMCMAPEVFVGRSGCYFENITSYLEEIKRKDLFVCYMVLSSPSSRNPVDDGRQYPALRVVGQDDEGLVISGVKLLGTSGVFADEVMVGCMMPLSPGMEDEAISCAIPMNQPGTRLFVRKPFARADASRIDAYFSSQFDESDVTMTFDKVRVPWSRVFVHGNRDVTRELFYSTPAHVMGNHQANWRYLSKLRIMNGIAHKAADMAGLLKVPAIQQTLGGLAAAEAAIEGMISTQIHNFEASSTGHVHINRKYLYATLHMCATQYGQLAEDVRLMIGGYPFLIPADSSILDDDTETGKIFEEMWNGPGADARQRYLFTRLAWDFMGSEFASRHAQYERFYGGPPHLMNLYSLHQCPWDERRASIDEIMADMAPAGE